MFRDALQCQGFFPAMVLQILACKHSYHAFLMCNGTDYQLPRRSLSLVLCPDDHLQFLDAYLDLRAALPSLYITSFFIHVSSSSMSLRRLICHQLWRSKDWTIIDGLANRLVPATLSPVRCCINAQSCGSSTSATWLPTAQAAFDRYACWYHLGR